MKHLQRVNLSIFVMSASLVLVACAEEECVETDAGGVCVETYEDGYYYDSRVSGLTYENLDDGVLMRTNVTGEGNDPGRFRFLDGQTIAFSLGATDLGEGAAKARVTPFDIAGVEEEAVGGCAVDEPLPEDEFRIVHNLAVLLQTMDIDGDPTNNIDITAEIAALFDEVNPVEVDQAWEQFQTDFQVVLDEANDRNLFSEERAMRAREEALGALYEGLGLCP